MKLRFKLLYFFTLLFIPLSILGDDKEKSERNYTVRVLLEENDDLNANHWLLHSKDGFILSDGSSRKNTIKHNELKIHRDKTQKLHVNGKKIVSSQLFITPISGIVSFNHKEYPGTLWITADNEKTLLINCVGIEDYVASVLCTESWPGWPLEMNKVLAIASRTYVIAMVQSSNVKQRPYHVKNTNVHQTYSGKTFVQHAQATQETRGLFLTYKNQPITAMFDACCGGIIPAKMHGVNFSSAPYLARKKACKYCKNWKHYSWVAAYNKDELAELLKKESPTLKKVKLCKITKKDPAGVVHQVHVKGHNHNFNLTGKKIYSLLNKGVKSFCFTVHHDGDDIIFEGKGYGHHLGLCQWGANGMVADGWDFRSILDFYYPGTKLMRLL